MTRQRQRSQGNVLSCSSNLLSVLSRYLLAGICIHAVVLPVHSEQSSVHSEHLKFVSDRLSIVDDVICPIALKRASKKMVRTNIEQRYHVVGKHQHKLVRLSAACVWAPSSMLRNTYIRRRPDAAAEAVQPAG